MVGMANVGLVTLAAQRAKSIGKTIYVGEYGGASPNFTGPTAADQAFPAAMLDLVYGSHVDFLNTEIAYLKYHVWCFDSI